MTQSSVHAPEVNQDGFGRFIITTTSRFPCILPSVSIRIRCGSAAGNYQNTTNYAGSILSFDDKHGKLHMENMDTYDAEEAD